MSGWRRGVSLSGLLLVSVWLAGLGCTTTTQGPDGRIVPPAAEPADPRRRAEVRLELAALYFGRGQSDTALEEVERALAVQPDMAQAHNLKGLILAGLGREAAALQSLQRAQSLAPRDGSIRHNQGWVSCQMRRYDEADQFFDAALKTPEYRDATRTLLARGVCQARAGRWSEAEAWLSRSYELDPANPVTAFNLAEVLLRRGELERARFYVQRINAVPDQVTAQSLWLAARIERRLDARGAVQDLGRQLQARFPNAPETLLFERGRFED